MNITLRSTVSGELTATYKPNSGYKHFDADLFRYLLPPGAQLIKFGGSKKGDIIHLKLPLVGEWISEITEDGASEDTCYFIDEGRKLPFPLKAWPHKHILRRQGNSIVVEDNMNFSTGYIVTDLLFYPVLCLSFLPRAWQYKKYFNEV